MHKMILGVALNMMKVCVFVFCYANRWELNIFYIYLSRNLNARFCFTAWFDTWFSLKVKDVTMGTPLKVNKF